MVETVMEFVGQAWMVGQNFNPPNSRTSTSELVNPTKEKKYHRASGNYND